MPAEGSLPPNARFIGKPITAELVRDTLNEFCPKEEVVGTRR